MFISNKRIISPILLFITFQLFSTDIRKVYPEEYKKALALKTHYETIFLKNGIEDTDFYISLVFPEMIRYNQIRDGLETLLNSIAYTTIDEYDGCSIGPFQIKPKCAFEIEQHVNGSQILTNEYPLIAGFTENENFTDKYRRITRLQQKHYQIEYLLAFVDICREKYNLITLRKEDQLRVISAAYNIGFLDEADDFKNYQDINSFPNGRNSPDSLWNYTELVIEFYEQFTECK